MLLDPARSVPARAHGGIVAAVFDDTMGFVLSMQGTPAFTGRLTDSYLAPTPVGEELEFRARLRERSTPTRGGPGGSARLLPERRRR